jgi:hypothetical protein
MDKGAGDLKKIRPAGSATKQTLISFSASVETQKLGWSLLPD